MELGTVREAFVGIVAVLLLAAAVRPKQLYRALRTFFAEPQSAMNLGLLRIFVFWTLFQAAITSEASWYAALPADRLKIRPGWEPLADVIPQVLPYTGIAEKAFVVASALALLGLFTRSAAAVTALLAVWVMGVPNFYFKLAHGWQVPVLTAFVLAASPAGDACSLDAWLRRLRGRPAPEPSVAYSLPVRFAWLLLGTSYLFPGFWKLWQSGDLWVDGTRMHVSLHEKWAQLPDYEPLVRVDHWPWALAAFGIATLVFEIGFLPALFFRGSRVVAGLTASAFHIGVGLTMDIWFDYVYPLIVLLDYPQLYERRVFRPLGRGLDTVTAGVRGRTTGVSERLSSVARRLGPARPLPRRSWLASGIVGAVLFGSMCWAGVTVFNSWPISIYPKFSSRTKTPQRKSFALRFYAKAPDGTERRLETSYQPIDDSSSIYTLLKTALRRQKRGDDEGAEHELRFIVGLVLGNNPPLARGETVVIRRYDFFVDPARRDDKEPRERLVAEVDPPPRVPAP